MVIAQEVKHKLELTVKKPGTQFHLTWEPEDLEMIIIWKNDDFIEKEDWKIEKKTLVFNSQIEKGSKLVIQEFKFVSKKKRKRK